jgi:hypothetical protein
MIASPAATATEIILDVVTDNWSSWHQALKQQCFTKFGEAGKYYPTQPSPYTHSPPNQLKTIYSLILLAHPSQEHSFTPADHSLWRKQQQHHRLTKHLYLSAHKAIPTSAMIVRYLQTQSVDLLITTLNV